MLSLILSDFKIKFKNETIIIKNDTVPLLHMKTKVNFYKKGQ